MINGDSLSDAGVGDELDARLFQVTDLVQNDVFVELETGNAVDQHATRHGPGFVDGDLMSDFDQVFGHGDARRS